MDGIDGENKFVGIREGWSPAPIPYHVCRVVGVDFGETEIKCHGLHHIHVHHYQDFRTREV